MFTLEESTERDFKVGYFTEKHAEILFQHLCLLRPWSTTML